MPISPPAHARRKRTCIARADTPAHLNSFAPAAANASRTMSIPSQRKSCRPKRPGYAALTGPAQSEPLEAGQHLVAEIRELRKVVHERKREPGEARFVQLHEARRAFVRRSDDRRAAVSDRDAPAPL